MLLEIEGGKDKWKSCIPLRFDKTQSNFERESANPLPLTTMFSIFISNSYVLGTYLPTPVQESSQAHGESLNVQLAERISSDCSLNREIT